MNSEKIGNFFQNTSDLMDLIFYICISVVFVLTLVFIISSQHKLEKNVTKVLNEIATTSLYQRKAAERIISNERLKTLSFDSGNV